MHADMWMDLASPWCYLNLVAFRKALAKFPHRNQVEVTFHPFYELMGHACMMPAMRQGLNQIAAGQGITFAWDKLYDVEPRDSAIRDAQIMLLYAAQVAPLEGNAAGADALHLKMAEALMRARFEVGLDLTDRDVLVGIAQDLGLKPKEVLQAIDDEGLGGESDEAFTMAIHLGVQTVPVLLYEEKYAVDGPQGEESHLNSLTAAWEALHETLGQ